MFLQFCIFQRGKELQNGDETLCDIDPLKKEVFTEYVNLAMNSLESLKGED